jgi:pectin methylesterase-like acyl-CoA thioesterase
VAGACWVVAVPAQATTIKVAPTGSTLAIQEAVDAASPGDTIKVAPGTYTGPTVSVKTSALTIAGSKSAVIDASGNTYGIRA